jgi:FPC/CPF motif-containing protein YcgG
MKNDERDEQKHNRDGRLLPPILFPFCSAVFCHHEGVTLFPRGERANVPLNSRRLRINLATGSVAGGVLEVKAMNDFLSEARREFQEFIMQPGFSCLGARAALHAESYAIAAYDELGSNASTEQLCRDLFKFVKSGIQDRTNYATFISIFRRPLNVDPAEFEKLLWQQLQNVNRIDARNFAWDARVSSDPGDPHFSFSFAGQAFYVIGLHAESPRVARRFKWPALVFNPHDQFEQLRSDGKWRSMQQAIRAREMELQGSVNPMLSDFGEQSEARQYSGRVVEETWRAPFVAKNHVDPENAAGRCPFAH